MKHIRDGNLVPNVLKWKANMEALMKNPPKDRKDYTPLFPSKGDFREIMTLIGSSGLARGTNVDSEDCDEKDQEMSSIEIDQWSSFPYMDQLANQVGSTKHSSQLFSLIRGQRVQEKGISSFDVDMVNTFLSIFLAKGKLSLACKLFEIFTDMGVHTIPL